MGAIVVVTAAGSPLGRRCVRDALADPCVGRVVAVGHEAPVDGDDDRLVTSGAALDDAALEPLLDGATDVVLLPPLRGAELDGTGGAEPDLVAVRGLLGALARHGAVRRLVVLSSALVYGARADNPVPLTEEAPVRPNPAVAGAVARAELEALTATWAAGAGADWVALRPCVVVAPEQGRWLARSPWTGAGLQVTGPGAPVQFLHVDDLASAVDVLRRGDATGPHNVAPDGWLTSDEVRSLKGPVPRLRLPGRAAVGLAGWGARLGLAPVDASALLAATAPWVVANDRLRALGWAPRHSSAEAYVEGDPGSVWHRLTPRHRQEIGLGAAAATVVGTATAVGLVVRRHLRSGSSG